MIALLLLAVASQMGAPAPTYLVERVIDSGTQTRRVSVFRDGTMVLAERVRDREPVVVRATLSSVELGVLRQVVEEAYSALQEASPSGAPGEATVELRLAPPDRTPLIVRYRLTAVPTLGAVRLGQAMDGLETRLLSRHPVRDDLSSWQPEVGDRVELEDGRIVEVTDVLDAPTGPLVRVSVGDGPVAVYYTSDELRRLAVRRLK